MPRQIHVYNRKIKKVRVYNRKIKKVRVYNRKKKSSHHTIGTSGKFDAFLDNFPFLQILYIKVTQM